MKGSWNGLRPPLSFTKIHIADGIDREGLRNPHELLWGLSPINEAETRSWMVRYLGHFVL